MRKYRYAVEKIRPDKSNNFDQQFWPVLIALVVLCSIAAGAIVTMVDGPWMWISLLVLPAITAFSIAILYRLDDSFLRRSLQFSILISFAIHLAILILTSLTHLFGNAFPQKELVVSKTPQRRIVITNRNKQFVFEESSKQQVQEQKQLEIEKKETTTTKTENRPMPVVERQQNVQSELKERKIRQTSIPKMAKKTSKRSRNEKNQPKASQASRPKKSTQNVAKSSSAAPSSTELSRSEPSTRRSSASKRAASESASAPAKESTISKRATNRQKIERQDQQAIARIRKSTSRMPKVASRRSDQSVPNKSSQIAARAAKSEPTQTRVERASTPKSQTQKRPLAKIASATEPLQTTSKRETRNKIEPRQNVSQAVSRQSQRNVTAKAPTATSDPVLNRIAASANTSRPSPQPQNMAISKSTVGSMGAGRSRNLERLQGGQPSPVSIASNSSSKRQSSRVSQNISMSASQKSSRLERGRSRLSKRALRSETANWSNKSGASNPAESTAEASSALVDSSSANSRSEFAAEKGASMLDIGATKVVTEANVERRGGGGSPDLSNSFVQRPQNQSGRQSNQLPTSDAQQHNVWQGPPETATSTQANTDSGAQSGQIAKSQPANPSGAIPQKIQNVEMGESGSGSSDGNAVATTAKRTTRDASEDGTMAELSGDTPTSGNARSRVAQAPRIDRQLNFGSDGAGQVDVVVSENDGSEMSATEMVRQTADGIAGGTMLGTATKVMAASMAGLPLFGERNGQTERRTGRETNFNSSDVRSAVGRSRNGSSLSPNATAQVESNFNGESLADSESVSVEASMGNLDRQSFDSSNMKSTAAVEIEAMDGVGGFGDTVSRRVGRMNDAISESDNLSPFGDSRFKRKTFGGVPNSGSIANFATEAFQGRNPANLGDSSPQTERAIELGLEFLARCQLPDGSWTLSQFDNEDAYFQNQLHSDTAATGLALLAFQGAGYNHREFKYASRIKSGIDWLMTNQSEDGGLYVETDKRSNKACRMYSHAIAALALAEAYGMTQDPEIKNAAQLALDYIVTTQHPRKGGWRYFADPKMRSTDTSVTGWMMMALKSGDLAGLQVPQTTMDGIEKWLRIAESPDSKSEFRYNPYAKNSEERARTHGKQASVTMTSVGLLMRAYSGWAPSEEKFRQGAEQILKQLPGDRDSLQRDTYYWYYATQVMKHAGGDYWEQWSSKLHPLLLGTQEEDGPLQGSWHPYKPVPDRWAPQGGRLYVTTMNLLSLEVKYRLLPLYENTIK